MVKKIALGFVALVLLFVVVVLMQPADYRIERSKTIQAPVARVFPMVADLREFPKFSPWQELDPNMEQTFKEPHAAVGGAYDWKGNDQVGKGNMTITSIEPNKKVQFALEFFEPFASKSTTGFDLVAEGEGTKVTWWMEGHNDFFGKLFGLFMDMEGMIGKNYEDGLNNLDKAIQS